MRVLCGSLHVDRDLLLLLHGRFLEVQCELVRLLRAFLLDVQSRVPSG